jgi:hypothetical protein
VGALYYDFRSSTSSTQMEVDAWFTSSGDGGAHFGNEQHLGGSYDLSAAPNVSSFGSSSPYIGSYQGLTAAGPRFQAAFVAVNPYGSSNPTDILTASIDP